jgi:hypothetical protein
MKKNSNVLQPLALTASTAITSFVLLQSVPAFAASITYNFTGTVGSVDSAASGSFSNGQTLTGSYTFDSTTAPRSGSTSTFAVYDALTNLSFNIGSYTASSTAAPEIQVDNNPGGGFHDRYGVLSRASDGLTGSSVSALTLDSFGFRLDDSTDTVFSSALNLPTTLNLSSFNSNGFFLTFLDSTSNPAIVSGTITSLGKVQSVPEPFTIIGTLIGGTAAFRMRKKLKAITG